MTRNARSVLLAALLSAPHAATAIADTIAGFCASRGGTMTTGMNDASRQTQFCVFKDGSRMNAVAFFRNQHRTMK